MLDAWVAECTGAADRETLDRWILGRLQKMLDDARTRSAFYRERFPSRQLRSLADFASLPFTTAEDLREYGDAMLCIPPKQVSRVQTLFTSGSSGAPKRICFSSEDQERTVEYFQHGMMEFAAAGDRVLCLFPESSAGGLTDLLAQAITRMGAQPLQFGYPTPERYEALLDTVVQQKATFLAGTAESVAGAARLSELQGSAELIAAQMHGVLLAAAYISPQNRADIARLWRCPVYEHYSMTETGFAGAVGCTKGRGYHVWESGVYYEIIDPVSGQSVPDGTVGEIVVTTLRQEAMPFLRYRTGDFSRFLPGQCTCGSCLRRLDSMQERDVGKKFERRNTVLFDNF